MVEKIRVLHIIYDLSVAGAQTVVMNILRGMKDDDKYEVRLIVRNAPNGSKNDADVVAEKLPVVYCNYKPYTAIPIIRTVINWFRCQRLFYKEIKKYNPDIIHTHLTDILPFTVIPEKLSNAKYFVHTLHSDPYAIEDRFVRWAKYAFNKLHFYPICVTESQVAKAQERYGITDCSVVHNGIDIDRYSVDESRDSIRKEVGVPEDTFVIGFVGRLSQIKNLGFLLKIFNEYQKGNEKAFLMIVGDGDQKGYCEQLIDEYGIKGKVVFAGQRADVERMYKAMDVFMLTSFYESNSIVTVEAQCAGVRCVVADSIPSSVVVSDLVNRISLGAPAGVWIDAIDDRVPHDRITGDLMKYSIQNGINELREVYEKHCKGI